jgi:hypothetical protein
MAGIQIYILADGIKFMPNPMLDDEQSTMNDAELPARWRRGSAERNAAACMLKRIRAGLDRRTRKVRRTRAAIRVGVYENDLKFHIAMDRMLADFLG